MLISRVIDSEIRQKLQKVCKRHDQAVKAQAQAIYRADNDGLAMAASRHPQERWQGTYPAMVRQNEKDLPELLSFFSLRVSPPCVKATAHYQCNQALLRGGAPSDLTAGLLCQRGERGPDHLCPL